MKYDKSHSRRSSTAVVFPAPAAYLFRPHTEPSRSRPSTKEMLHLDERSSSNAFSTFRSPPMPADSHVGVVSPEEMKKEKWTAVCSFFSFRYCDNDQ